MNAGKIKILLVGRYEDTEILSGPGKVAKRIFAELKNKCHSEFWEYYFDGSVYGYTRKLFGSENICPEPGIEISRKGIFPVVFSLIKMKPDLVHIITFERFSFIFLLLKPLLGYKICYSVHGIVTHEKKINARPGLSFLNVKDYQFEKMLFKKADKLFFLSEKAVKIASKYFNIDKSKVTMIKNGIDKVFFSRGISAVENDNCLTLVTVGDFDRREKGIEFLISAFKNLSVHVILTIIGKSIPEIENENTEKLRIICCNKQSTDDYAALLSRNQVFVSASSYDTYNIASVEAMAAGLTPVLTRETGSAFLIDNENNGFLYDFGDGDTLNKYIERIFNNPELRNKIRKNAAAEYASYKWDAVAAEYLNIYNDLLAQ